MSECGLQPGPDRLAAPEAMPELLREIIEVGKVAIVAETGVLWLLDKRSGQLVMVVPSGENPTRLDIGEGWAGLCAQSSAISNIHEVLRHRPDEPANHGRDACVFAAASIRRDASRARDSDCPGCRGRRCPRRDR